jgi:uncharacterized protein YndB with AHSA1/START domain
MDTFPLVFVRDIEFPTVIVWDAFVDAELVSGWLGEARITPAVGGEFRIEWRHRPTIAPLIGTIVDVHAPERLTIDTIPTGRVWFELAEFPGGSRGTSTRVRVTVDVAIEPVFAARVRADWLTNLDQLEELLRGHPVDWAHWDRDWGSAWSTHLDEGENSTA